MSQISQNFFDKYITSFRYRDFESQLKSLDSTKKQISFVEISREAGEEAVIEHVRIVVVHKMFFCVYVSEVYDNQATQFIRNIRSYKRVAYEVNLLFQKPKGVLSSKDLVTDLMDNEEVGLLGPVTRKTKFEGKYVWLAPI